jgi:hypothetical protein
VSAILLRLQNTRSTLLVADNECDRIMFVLCKPPCNPTENAQLRLGPEVLKPRPLTAEFQNFRFVCPSISSRGRSVRIACAWLLAMVVLVAGCASAREKGGVEGDPAVVDAGAARQGRTSGDEELDSNVEMGGGAPDDEGLDGEPADAGIGRGDASIEAVRPAADGSLLFLDAQVACATATIAGRVTVAGEGLENVEICIACSGDVSSVVTDGEGRYAMEISLGDVSPLFPVRCGVTPRLSGYRFEPSSVSFTDEEMCAGISNADFVTRAIAPAPNATGSWELVSYRCPSDPALEYRCSPRETDGSCANRAICPRETGDVFTFEQGCLFLEESSDCVDGNLYTEGSGVCRSYYPQRFSTDRYHEGEFDEETQTWHITETTVQTAMGWSTMGPVLAELALERAGD